MATFFTSGARTNAQALLPSALARILDEARLIVGVSLWLGAVLALYSYNKRDRAFSTSGDGSVTANWLGLGGAWFADCAYYVAGFSVWWLVFFSALELLNRARSVLFSDSTQTAVDIDFDLPMPALAKAALFAKFRALFTSTAVVWLGLLLLLVGSWVLESTRLYALAARLPFAAGGAVGDWLGLLAQRWLGFTPSAIAALLLIAVGAALCFGFSWLQLAERIGAWLESRFGREVKRREVQEDVEAGRTAARAREEQVILARVDHVQAAPIVIEQPVIDVPQSKRVVREKQRSLFVELPDSPLPQIDLLDAPLTKQETVSADILEFTSRLIEKKLKDFGVDVRVVAAYPGPVITRYEIEPATGVKGSQVVGLARDLARSLSLVSIRVVETIPGKNYMALELPNARRQMIRHSEILGSRVYADNPSMLVMGLGKDIVGNPIVADLGKMPHLLVAGTTGSGKSVGINAMILSLLYKATPDDVRLLLIDPKMLEMSMYEGIPHLLAPVVTDMKQAAHGLNWCVAEMERRYKLMSKMGVRQLSGFNQKISDAKARGELVPNPLSLTPDAPEPLERLPYIVVVIDELADLMMVIGKKIEELIARLAQKARAAGIHLILATQRPSVDVITGLIKANVPSRISFQVSSKIDSRTILDQMGAESLLGMGDMLYMAIGTQPVRVHGAFVSDAEVQRVCDFLRSKGAPDYVEGMLTGESEVSADSAWSVDGVVPSENGDGEKDALYDQAVVIVMQNRKASISLVQRHLRIGYNRSARLLEQMEKSGLIGALEPNGSRAVLVPNRE